MINAATLANKFSVMPDRKTVQYFARQVPGDGWGAAVPVADCEKRWPSRKDMESQNAQIRSSDSVWHLWKVKLGAIKPKEGDKIEFENEKWLVSAVVEELQGQRFRCYCRKGV